MITNIEITRSTNSYEDITLSITSIFRPFRYRTKSITQWDKQTLKFSISEVSVLTLNVKILNETSDYNVRIYHTEPTFLITAWVIVVFISICICCIIWGICFICLRCIKQRLRNRMIHTGNNRRNRIQQFDDMGESLIARTMNNMHSGQYKSLKGKYEQNVCVICLEDYTWDSQVHLTNECQHLFHSDCLRKWYETNRTNQ